MNSRRFLLRFANLFRRPAAEREMAREIASHLALLQEEFERQGLAPEDAALAARRAYGGVEQSKELHREARSFVWVEQFFRDLLYGARNLRRAPGFAILAALALALGIGVNATVFSLYDAILLKPLPVADSGRVFRLQRWFERGSHSNGGGAVQFQFAWPEYEYLRAHATSFAGFTASTDVVALASFGGSAYGDPLAGQVVSTDFFADLGVKPMLGRTLQEDEEAAAVLGFRFWHEKLHGDLNVLGRSIKLNGIPFTVVGVMPEEFRGTALVPIPTAFWTSPAMLERLEPSFKPGWRQEWRDSTHDGFILLARLKKGVSREQAQAETDLLMRQFLAGRHESERTTSVTLRRTSYWTNPPAFFDAELLSVIAMLLGLVLLVSCANTANMLLARGIARRREIGIRLALGASRGRVIRQLLAESFLLALAGGAVGVLVSIWSGKVLWASLAGVLQGLMTSVNFDVDVSPDARVLVFGAMLSALTTFLFGLAPAFASTRIEISASMKPLRQRLRGLLLAAQVAAVVVLLALVGNLGSSVRKSRIADIGFEPQNVYMTNFIYSSETVDPKSANRRLLQRLATIPGVDSVAVGDVPMWNGKQQPMQAGSVKHYACLVSYGSGNYLETLRLPILRGRSFTQGEAERDAPVAVVSEFTARLYWPNQDPIGKRFSLGSDSRTSFEVIGVARNVRFNDLSEPDELHVYLPSMEKHSGSLLFRIRGDRERALEAVRAEISNIDPQLLPALILVSLEDGPFRIFRSYLRVFAVFTGTLTALSLTLAAIGIYGVMSFLVGQRTKELGIRMALGATSRGVVRSVMFRGLAPVLIGMTAGFVMAGALGAWLEHMDKEFPQPILQEFFAHPSAYAELAFILAVALLASIVPARRATRVDPVMALRHE